VRRLALLLIAATFAFGMASCAHPQARTQPEHVPLDVPLPPARIIMPPSPEEPPEVASQPPEAPSPKPARPRPAPSRTEPAPPATAPAAQPAPATGTLQTAPPASQAEMVKTIRDLLARANRDLKSVARSSLNADGKAQFDTAQRFADQAEQALKEMNLVFALTLADKAATLARSLAGRF
jgi:outer membrane biosynthesis protein TonB